MGQIAVGRTPLRKSIELCGRCNGAIVFVKDESKNPFGTFKDRRCAALLEKDAERQELLFVHITSGNSGYSMGMMAKEFERVTGRKRAVVNIVPKGLPRAIKRRLETCSVVVEADLSAGIITPDQMRVIARKASGYEGPEDNIVGVEDYGLANGYRAIVKEIREHGVKPTHIFCPVGEGELAAEIAAACETAWGADAPKVVGVTIKQNAIMKKDDFLKNVGKSVADKLLNGYSKFKGLLLNFVKTGRAELMTANEGEIAKEYAYLNGIGIPAEPSAAAAFAGAERYGLREGDIAVVINTGKGVYDERRLKRAWLRRLKKACAYTAFFIMGTVTALGITGYNAMHGRESRSRLMTEALYYHDGKFDHSKFVGNLEDICYFVKTERHLDPVEPEGETRRKCRDSPWSISDNELEFYRDYKRAESNNDNLGRQMMADYTERFRRGEYDNSLSRFRMRHRGAFWDELKAVFRYYTRGY